MLLNRSAASPAIGVLCGSKKQFPISICLARTTVLLAFLTWTLMSPLVAAETDSLLAAKSTPATLISVLDRFTGADVPAIGPGESEVPPPYWTIGPVPADLPGKGLAQHPMLYIGERCNKMFLVNGGKVVWTYSTGKGGEFDDAWLLSNGNILFSRMGYAEEITPQKKVVWHRAAPKNSEIHSVQPIGLDKVLILQNGLPPRLMIVNKQTGTAEVDHELTPPRPNPGLPPNPKVALDSHGQFRRGRITAGGTYLISWMSLGKVIEYDQDFKEIWSCNASRPWAAVRLRNGNTLITDEKEQLTREVNPKGETVWEFKLPELPPGTPMIGSQSCVRLANGNTVICSVGGSRSGGGAGKACQIIEVTPDKKVVWALCDWKTLGPCTAVQLLDEPGVPENPGELGR